MSKRLIKTAKQQFDERLKELTVIKEFQFAKSDIYYLCENEHHEMSILRNIHDNEFCEYKYDKSYQELIKSEEFLREMSTRFNEADIPIKPLFEWYASADKDNEPFTLDDIVMCSFEAEGCIISFEDIYKEVSEDEPFSNTRAQARKEIEDNGMVLEYESDNGMYYAADVDGKFQVICIWNESVPTKYIFGESRKKVCESSAFRNAMLMHLALDRGSEEVDKFAAWIKGSITQEPFDVFDIIGALQLENSMAIIQEYKEKPDNRIVMNVYDPFNWLRIEDNGTWGWVSEFCNDANEYGRLDVLYDIIDGELDVKDEFENPSTMEEIKADYEKSFPLLMAGVFENLAEAIKSGELKFRMDYTKEG